MSDPSTAPDRPPHVTVAVGIAIVGSVFVVLAVWDRIAGLHSLDTRDSLRSVLDVPMLKDSGMTIGELRAVVKLISMVAAGCAAAIAVLGFRTLRRSRSARLGMTVLAVPMFVAGLFADGIFSSGVAAAVATLWFGQARVWFGDDVRRPYDAVSARRLPDSPPPHGWAPPSGPPQAPNLGSAPATWVPPAGSAYDLARPAGGGRPTAMLVGCLVTWLCCGVTVLIAAMSLTLLAADSATLLDRMHEQDPQLAERGISDHEVLVISYVTGSVVIVWALVAAVLAALAFRRNRMAWYALLVSTAGVVVLSLLGVLASVVMLVPLAAAITALVLLVRPEVKRWISG